MTISASDHTLPVILVSIRLSQFPLSLYLANKVKCAKDLTRLQEDHSQVVIAASFASRPVEYQSQVREMSASVKEKSQSVPLKKKLGGEKSKKPKESPKKKH